MNELNKRIDTKKIVGQQVIGNNDEYKEALNSSSEVVKALLTCMEMKDIYNKSHSILTSYVSIELSKELQLNTKTQINIEIAALLHDIGNIKTPDYILKKDEKLTLSESELTRQHIFFGEQIISSLPSIKHLSGIVRHHHERFDGKGYPDGLKNNEIPIESRIITLADTLASLCTARPYRSAMGIDEAVEYISQNAGKIYDTQVVNAFKTLCRNGIITEIFSKYSEDNY